MATQIDHKELDLQEQLARIRKTQGGIDKMFDERSRIQTEIDKMYYERSKIQTEIKVIPATMIFQAMLASAALIGAGAAIAKLFFH